jgi:hypothetical protein
MDSAIAVIIIVVAGYFVFTKVSRQLRNKKKGGCGCGDDCASGSCGLDRQGQCPGKEEGE